MTISRDALPTAREAGQHKTRHVARPDTTAVMTLSHKPYEPTSASLSSARASATASSTIACCALFLSRFFTGSYPDRPHNEGLGFD